MPSVNAIRDLARIFKPKRDNARSADCRPILVKVLPTTKQSRPSERVTKTLTTSGESLRNRRKITAATARAKKRKRADKTTYSGPEDVASATVESCAPATDEDRICSVSPR